MRYGGLLIKIFASRHPFRKRRVRVDCLGESYTTQFLDPGLIDIVVFALLLIMLAVRPTGLIAEKRAENV